MNCPMCGHPDFTDECPACGEVRLSVIPTIGVVGLFLFGMAIMIFAMLSVVIDWKSY